MSGPCPPPTLFYHPLPLRNLPFHEPKQRMRRRGLSVTMVLVKARFPTAELFQQVLPFVHQLALGGVDHAVEALEGDLAHVEGIAALLGFLVHGSQVGRDGGLRVRRRAETFKLRMIAIAL